MIWKIVCGVNVFVSYCSVCVSLSLVGHGEWRYKIWLLLLKEIEEERELMEEYGRKYEQDGWLSATGLSVLYWCSTQTVVEFHSLVGCHPLFVLQQLSWGVVFSTVDSVCYTLCIVSTTHCELYLLHSLTTQTLLAPCKSIAISHIDKEIRIRIVPTCLTISVRVCQTEK